MIILVVVSAGSFKKGCSMGIALQTAIRETQKNVKAKPAYTRFRITLLSPSRPGRAQAMVVGAKDDFDARWHAMHAQDKKTFASLTDIDPGVWNNPKLSRCIPIPGRVKSRGVIKIEFRPKK